LKLGQARGTRGERHNRLLGYAQLWTAVGGEVPG
jgi:hypothetical protein